MEQIEKFEFETKEEMYEYLNMTLEGLICEEKDWLANLANTSALMWMLMEKINWVGFYLHKNNELVLGPFQGKPACTHIELGRGVCGTAAKQRATQLVSDVHEFAGHIACDNNSNSEIVIPLIKNDKLFGVIDIDSPFVGRFDDVDKKYLEKSADLISRLIEFPNCFI